MSSPLDLLQSMVRGDVITPTPAEIERNVSVAGTYLFTLDENDINALRAGKFPCFYMEDHENILIRLCGEARASDNGPHSVSVIKIDTLVVPEHGTLVFSLPSLVSEADVQRAGESLRARFPGRDVLVVRGDGIKIGCILWEGERRANEADAMSTCDNCRRAMSNLTGQYVMRSHDGAISGCNVCHICYPILLGRGWTMAAQAKGI